VNCNRVSYLLSAFMDGELLGYEHRLIHHHLQRCADCQSEYDELLQMKRMLAAMRLQEPGQRLAAGIVQRVAAERESPSRSTIGGLQFSLPSLRGFSPALPPVLGLGVGIAMFGVLFLSRPSTHAAVVATGHRALEFEPADIAREEPAPHLGELTYGLTREATPRQVSYEPGYPDNLPDFPLRARRAGRSHQTYFSTSVFR
jgi:anti-sigma factor RsiW